MNRQNLVKLRLTLFVAGVALVITGASMILSQVNYYHFVGIQVNLPTETKILAGFLLAAGINVIACTFVRGLMFTATVLVAIVYLSYAAWSMVGMPAWSMLADVLLQLALLELAIGLISLVTLPLYKTIQQE